MARLSFNRLAKIKWPRVLAALVAVVAISLATSVAEAQRSAAAPKGFRKLAPGVETTIPVKSDPEDTVTNHDIAEIQALGAGIEWKPATQSSTTTLKVLTKDIPFRRGVWYLEFTFKPLRMMWVDLPQEGGRAQRKLVWYLVYRVKNLGGHLNPVAKGDGNEWENQLVDYPVYFFPQFVLESHEFKKAYLDRVMPLAVAAIQQREDPNRKLLDSVEISSKPIAVSKPGEDASVWGVATWEDVDPAIDYFSIYVKGLTSAYRFLDPPGAFKPGDPPATGRRYAQKTLKLNFWRPGDEFDRNEADFYYGIPGQVDHTWVFR